MDKFDEYIKSKLENFEMPCDEGSWLKIKDKLPTKSHKLFKYSIVTTFVIIIGMFSYNNSSFNTSEMTKCQIKQKSECNIIAEIPKKEKETSIDFVPTTKVQITIPVYNIVENTVTTQDLITLDEPIIIEPVQENIILSEERKDTDSVFISPPSINQITYFIPNAFSPNDDGINDEFSIIGENLDSLRFQLLVYDRWGKQVFETMSPNYKWSGKNCESGVYVWILRIQEQGNVRTEKGKLTLLK